MANPLFVRVVNESADPHRAKFDLKPFFFAAGQAHFVPWEAATTWLGDPAKVNDNQLLWRDIEDMRLRTLYGIYHDEIQSRDRFPNLKVYGPDGTELSMLVDILYGDARHVAPDNPSDPAIMLAQLQQQVATLTALITERGPSSPVVDVPELVPADFKASDLGLDVNVSVAASSAPAATPAAAPVVVPDNSGGAPIDGPPAARGGRAKPVLVASG